MRYFILLISICVSVFSIFETTAQSKTFKAKSEIISQEHKLTPIFKDFTTFTLDSDQFNNHVANRSWSDNITLQIDPELTWSFHLEPVGILTDQSKIYELTPDGKSLSSLKPMPPETLLPALGSHAAAWAASPARAGLEATVAAMLKAESGRDPDIDTQLAGGYEALRPCLAPTP